MTSNILHFHFIEEAEETTQVTEVLNERKCTDKPLSV